MKVLEMIRRVRSSRVSARLDLSKLGGFHPEPRNRIWFNREDVCSQWYHATKKSYIGKYLFSV